MGRANTIQTNFTAGEVSPRMYGRVDINKYFNGARKLRNMIVAPQGGAYRRPGTKFVVEAKTSAKKTILRKFIFSENQAYVFEFGEYYIRFIRNGAQIESVPGVPFEQVTPYGENDLARLRFTQSADVVYVCHPNYQTRLISRTSATTFTVGLFETIDGPYMSVDNPSTDSTTTKLKLVQVQDTATALATGGTPFTVGTLKTITNVAASGNLIKITAVAHGYATSNTIAIAGVSGAVEANGSWVITKVDNDNFTLNGSYKIAANTYVSGGVTGPTLSSTYIEYRENNQWKLAKILLVQTTTQALVDVSDIVFQVRSGVELNSGAMKYNGVSIDASEPSFSILDVKKQIRATDTKIWYTATNLDNSKDMDVTLLSTVISYSYPTVQITVSDRRIYGLVTATPAIATTFVSTDLGRKLRMAFLEKWVPATIVLYVNNYTVFCKLDVFVPLDPGDVTRPMNEGAVSNWKLGAWSNTTGWPGAAVFHQDRLTFGGTNAEPQTMWLSESGDYVGFSSSNVNDSSVSDANAITITMVSRQVNRILWFDTGPVLLVGTEGAEWQVKPSSITQTLTPTNVSATMQTGYGSVSTTDDIRVGSRTLFIQRAGRTVREMAYDFQIDAFVSNDLSIISEHVGRLHGGLIEFALQVNPFAVLWIVLGDGLVAGLTYEREHEVVGWHLHQIGGGGIVESVTCIPTSSDLDDVYFLVKRTINGSTKRYIERMPSFPIPGTVLDHLSGIYLDSHVATDYSFIPGGVLYGTMDCLHLPNTSVGVVVDGFFCGMGTTSGGGTLFIGYKGYVLAMGFVTEAVIGLLEPEGGSDSGTSQGKLKRIAELTVRIENSLYFKQACGTGRTDDYMFISGWDDPGVNQRKSIAPPLVPDHPPLPGPDQLYPHDDPVELLNGDLTFAIDDSYNDGALVDLVQDQPYPFNVIAIMPKLDTNE